MGTTPFSTSAWWAVIGTAVVLTASRGALAGVCPASGSAVNTSLWSSSLRLSKDTGLDGYCISSSPDTRYADSLFLQLYQPESFPWRLTHACFGIYLSSKATAINTTTVWGQISVYGVEVDRSNGYLRPGERRSFVPFTASLRKGTYKWTTVDLPASTPLVVWEKAAFIGVSWMSCQPTYILVGKSTAITGAVVWMRENFVWSQTWGSDGIQGVTRRISLMADGEPYSLPSGKVHPGWTCNASLYNNSVCNCGCGAMDIDCKSTPFSDDCPGGYICDQAGKCIKVPWSLNTSGSNCTANNYWSYDGCQCECGGIMDPDCFNPFATADVCSTNFSVPRCRVNTSSTTTKCYEYWKCNASKYNDGKICDCECGSDPDCATTTLNTTCENNMKCLNGVCKAPRAWTCGLAMYNDGTTCTCNCGTYDIDCDVSSKVYGCDNNEVCNYTGKCVTSGCGNGYAEKSEECDGGRGCNSQCKCETGWQSKSPTRADCVEICGDSTVAGTEECDGGKFCTSCKCQSGHEAYSPAISSCQGCGDGIVSGNESCDGGTGCSLNCTCYSGYHSFSVPRSECERDEDNKKAIIAGSVGGGSALILLVAVGASLIYAKKVKYGPRPLNIPVEIAETVSQVSDGVLPGFMPALDGTVSFASADQYDTYGQSLSVGVFSNVPGAQGATGTPAKESTTGSLSPPMHNILDLSSVQATRLSAASQGKPSGSADTTGM